MTAFDVVILGAGAAGLMCAIEAGRRGRRVLLVDHAQAPGEKIRISGGGRCNFTNLRTTPQNFLSANPHFGVSALKRYGQADFVAKVDAHGIAWHEKTLGQLFCDGSARQIVEMLTGECRDAGVRIQLGTTVGEIARTSDGFAVALAAERATCTSLVIATGGKSIPKMGASSFGYRVAEQFGLALVTPRPALVPLTFDGALLEATRALAGIAVDAVVSCRGTRFAEGMLFTHRGLSGPSILQISSFWREGDPIELAMAPGHDVYAELRALRARQGRQAPHTALAAFLPKRVAQFVAESAGAHGTLGDLSDPRLRGLDTAINRWRVVPTGSEGWRTAEVTLGGVDTDGLDSRTMAAKAVPGLFFIGEVVDVTGWLGGYNFQWAWSSGWAAGQVA
jgi:predicted Rossmann fold flavoprotein